MTGSKFLSPSVLRNCQGTGFTVDASALRVSTRQQALPKVDAAPVDLCWNAGRGATSVKPA